MTHVLDLLPELMAHVAFTQISIQDRWTGQIRQIPLLQIDDLPGRNLRPCLSSLFACGNSPTWPPIHRPRQVQGRQGCETAAGISFA